MSALPEGWEWATLSDVAKWGSGGTPKKGVAGYYDGAIPWAVIGDLNDGVVTECANSITELALSKSSAKPVEPGAILIAMYGSIGKLGVVGVPMATNQAIAFAKPYDVLDSAYLFNYLLSQRNSLNSEGKGATQLNISQTILKAWPIPVPPLPEQRRIVAAIEEHFSRLDAAEASVNSAEMRTNALKRSLLTAMFDGLENECALDEVCDVVSGQTPKKLAQAEPGDVPFVKVGDMNNTADGLVRTARQQISRSSADELRLHIRPAGTVIFPKRGGAIATNKKRTLAVDACFDLNTMGVIPGPDVLSSFLRHWFETVDLGSLSDGSNVPQINHGDIKPLRIPVPPIADQARLVAEIDEALEFVAAGERGAAAAARRVAPARSAILAAAFSGQLVPQDPSDEPASMLLERIAAERAASKPSRKKKGAS